MADIVIRTEQCPEANGHLKEYWLAWADGVQSDGESEQEAIDNAKAALAREEPVCRGGAIYRNG